MLDIITANGVPVDESSRRSQFHLGSDPEILKKMMKQAGFINLRTWYGTTVIPLPTVKNFLTRPEILRVKHNFPELHAPILKDIDEFLKAKKKRG